MPVGASDISKAIKLWSYTIFSIKQSNFIIANWIEFDLFINFIYSSLESRQILIKIKKELK
jgi:hypothetical protein